jgi:hypothetical protein
MGKENESTKKALSSLIDLYKSWGKKDKLNYYSQVYSE